MLPNLRAFVSQLPPGCLTRDDIVCPETLLASDGDLSVYFVPFGYFPEAARIGLVGITPGFEQMRLAYEVAREYQDQATDDEHLYRRCGAQAGFGGPMRKLLVEMLDDIGVQTAMNLRSSAELFDATRNDVLRCSVLRHPVFVSGENYTGHRPKMTSSPFLMRLVRDYFARSIATTPAALLVPMGRAVEEVLRDLKLPNPVLWGFPHPSPANGHRRRQLEANRADLRKVVAEVL